MLYRLKFFAVFVSNALVTKEMASVGVVVPTEDADVVGHSAAVFARIEVYLMLSSSTS